MKEKERLLNDSIMASVVQVITDSGENLGEMNIEEAKGKARALGVDLMEIGRNGSVSIVKLVDYGKFLYRQKKQEQKNKQKTKILDVKNIRISFKIGDHDLDFRRKQAENFAKIGHPLKVSLMLRGRENQYEGIAMEKMKSFINSMEAFYKLDGEIKKAGNTFFAQLKPIK